MASFGASPVWKESFGRDKTSEASPLSKETLCANPPLTSPLSKETLGGNPPLTSEASPLST
eukprot:4352359-Prorocentrum_lima.AAC.1